MPNLGFKRIIEGWKTRGKGIMKDSAARYLRYLHKKARSEMILEEAERYRRMTDEERWKEFCEVLSFADSLIKSSDCAVKQLEHRELVPESSARLWKELLERHAPAELE